jgi:hypothetical protein
LLIGRGIVGGADIHQSGPSSKRIFVDLLQLVDIRRLYIKMDISSTELTHIMLYKWCHFVDYFNSSTITNLSTIIVDKLTPCHFVDCNIKKLILNMSLLRRRSASHTICIHILSSRFNIHKGIPMPSYPP